MGFAPPSLRDSERSAHVKEVRNDLQLSVGQKIRIEYGHPITQTPKDSIYDSYGISYAEGTVTSIAYGEAPEGLGGTYTRVYVSIPSLAVWTDHLTFWKLLFIKKVGGSWWVELEIPGPQHECFENFMVNIEPL